MYTKSSGLPCASVQRWTEAGASLASALKAYLSACSHLETSTSPQNSAYPTDLVSQIDSSLNSLHITLDRELAQSRAILARTRNRIASPLYLLPEELLSEIFLDVIYASTPEKRATDLAIVAGIQTIYRHLHSLIGVCSTWRKAAINCGALWNVIPMVDPGLKIGPVQHFATNLSLERASTRLHLAAVLDRGDGCNVYRLIERASHFQTCNVHSETVDGITRLIGTLLACGNFTSLSELSIYETPINQERDDLQVPEEVDYFFYKESPLQSLFSTLLQSLSVLRITGALVHWDKVAFSTRLSEIHLQEVTLGYDTDLIRFFIAITSARELRELRMISVIAFLSNNLKSPLSGPFTSFPNLQSLTLHDLPFNVLELVMGGIAPGSHRLTLLLTETSNIIYNSDNTHEIIDTEVLLNLFGSVAVDTLMLREGWDDNWITRLGIRELLGSMPGLRRLLLDDWQIDDQMDWCSFTRSAPGLAESTAFPRISEFYLTNTRFLHVAGINEVVADHPLQKLVVGACISTEDSDDADDWDDKLSHPRFQDEYPDIVAWLRASVPDVRLTDVKYLPVEFQAVRWRLW